MNTINKEEQEPKCGGNSDLLNNSMNIIMSKIETMIVSNHNNFKNVLSVMAYLTTMVGNLSAEIGSMKINMEAYQANITFSQDLRENKNKLQSEKIDPPQIYHKYGNRLPTFNKQTGEGDSPEEWNDHLQYENKSSQHQETEENELLKCSGNFDYEKQLKEISSITSVFNLSHSLDRDNNEISQIEKPYGLKEIEEKLDDLKQIEICNGTPETCDVQLQSDRIKHSLFSYLKNKDEKHKFEIENGNFKEDENENYYSPKFMNFF